MAHDENPRPFRFSPSVNYIDCWFLLNELCSTYLHRHYWFKSNVDFHEGIKTNRSIISHHNHYHEIYLLHKSVIGQ